MQESSLKNIEITLHSAKQAAKRFATALSRSSVFQRYERALIQLRQNNEAQNLLNEFQQEQQNYQKMQSWGGVTNEDYQRLLKKQEKMLAHPVLKNLIEAQEDLVKLLQEVNAFISDQIGINFAGVAKPAGGCC